MAGQIKKEKYLTVSQLNGMHVNPAKIFLVQNCKCCSGSHPAR